MRIIPKNIFDLDKEENAELREMTKISICFLPIGIGQACHIGEEWRGTIHQMNQHFGAVVIVPVDGLHRFTEMMKDKSLTEAQAEHIALTDGDRWLHDVEDLNKKFKVPVVISRWSEWVGTSEYANSKNRIDQSYNDEDSDFRSDVDIVINTFITGFINKQVKAKNGNQPVRFNLKRATELCKRYLLEELAFVDMIKNGCVASSVFDFFGGNQRAHFLENPFFMAYPFGHNSTNEDVYNCFEKLCSDGKLSFLNLSKPPKKPRQRKNNLPLNLSADSSQQRFEDEDIFVLPKSITTQIEKLQHTAAVMHSDQVSQNSPREGLAASDNSDHAAGQLLLLDQKSTKESDGCKIVCKSSLFNSGPVSQYSSAFLESLTNS